MSKIINQYGPNLSKNQNTFNGNEDDDWNTIDSSNLSLNFDQIPGNNSFALLKNQNMFSYKEYCAPAKCKKSPKARRKNKSRLCNENFKLDECAKKEIQKQYLCHILNETNDQFKDYSLKTKINPCVKKYMKTSDNYKIDMTPSLCCVSNSIVKNLNCEMEPDMRVFVKPRCKCCPMTYYDNGISVSGSSYSGEETNSSYACEGETYDDSIEEECSYLRNKKSSPNKHHDKFAFSNALGQLTELYSEKTLNAEGFPGKNWDGMRKLPNTKRKDNRNTCHSQLPIYVRNKCPCDPTDHQNNYHGDREGSVNQKEAISEYCQNAFEDIHRYPDEREDDSEEYSILVRFFVGIIVKAIRGAHSAFSYVRNRCSSFDM